MPCRSRGYKDAKPKPHLSAEIPPRRLGAFAFHAKVRLRSGCEQAKTPRGGVFVKRYPKDRKRKERAMPRHSATISAGRKRRDGASACAHSAGASPRPTRIALRPYLCLIPAVILERSEGSKRDYKSKNRKDRAAMFTLTSAGGRHSPAMLPVCQKAAQKSVYFAQKPALFAKSNYNLADFFLHFCAKKCFSYCYNIF